MLPKTQTGWMDTKTRPVSTRYPLETYWHTQAESKGAGEDIPCKCKLKESQSMDTYIRQNRL